MTANAATVTVTYLHFWVPLVSPTFSPMMKYASYDEICLRGCISISSMCLSLAVGSVACTGGPCCL